MPLTKVQSEMSNATAPAFSAYGTAYQTVANTTYTKIAYNTLDFDTNSNYNTSTYRFTPTVAGYYQVNAAISSGTSASGQVQIVIYKNGSAWMWGNFSPNASQGPSVAVSGLVQCNGSTDFIEIFGWQNSGGNLNLGSGGSTLKFQACLVRPA